jgi:multiple sugar transport system permease protein
MATTTATISLPRSTAAGRGWSSEAVWGAVMVIPYAVIFLAFVVWPVAYGVWLGADPAAFRRLLADPIYLRSAWNTAVFLAVGINLKLALALVLSGFFARQKPWIRWLSVLFLLPWAVPSIPTIFSIRWMLNSEWGMLNGALWELFRIEGPWWLIDPELAFGSVIATHIWKYLPFWTLILLAGRMAIPTDLYEAATIDGASPWQKFAYVTWPNLKNLYITSTLLSTIWSLGDFNSVYLLTGGGPAEKTHVLATLGIRYAFNLQEISVGVATVMTALPVLVPLVVVLVRRLGRRAAP